ncbi:MAG: glycosyltransferase family 1 protein [Thermoleophilia bacterium]|nr:glycosyltransferase family 1 protein [Thermoleophilia bacterium]
MKILFVAGCESTRDYPGDTPEAYWRVLLPARRFGRASVVGSPNTEQMLRVSDALWIYEPTSPAAVHLADFATRLGKPVVVDFAEDIWRRQEQDREYHATRLEAARETMDRARLIVVAHPGLEAVYGPYGHTATLETVFPLTGWTRPEGQAENIIGWWSDGRQKRGFEAVAPAVGAQLAKGLRSWHIQFAHHRPLVAGLSGEARRAEATKLGAWFADDISKDADGVCRYYRDLLARCLVSLECYQAGAYAETVSDVPLLRAAAIGIPSLSTREQVPPGTAAAPATEWPETLDRLLADPAWRKDLTDQGARWVASRSDWTHYAATISTALK